MEKSKTKGILIAVIILLILIIAILVCYIVIDKNNSSKEDKSNNEPKVENISSEDKKKEDNNEPKVENISSEDKKEKNNNELKTEKIESRNLTTKELEYFENYFNDSENNGFLITEYNKPKEVNINDVLYSNSIGKDLTQEEEKEYSKLMGWEEPPTQCFKYKKDDINNLLKNKMNISLSDLEIKLNYLYIEKYDAYFDIHGDTNYIPIEVTSGKINDDGLYIINYTMDDEEKTVVMEKSKDNYLFISNT